MSVIFGTIKDDPVCCTTERILPVVLDTLIRPPGQRSTITADEVAAIVEDVRTGMGVRGAAWRQGRSQQCVQRWVTKGEQLWMREGVEFDNLSETDQLYVALARGVTRHAASVSAIYSTRSSATPRRRTTGGRGRGYWNVGSRRATAPTPRVLAAVQLGQLAQPLLAGENPWDHLPPQTIEQIAISHLRQLRELGAVPPEQAEVIEQLEQDYDFPAGRYPVRKGEAAESVEGISRQAVVREAQPAQEPTAAEPQAVELSEDELLELGRRLCAEGTHVGRRARMQTCIGCGLTQSRPLRLVEEFA
jgi:hypothetical protein